MTDEILGRLMKLLELEIFISGHEWPPESFISMILLVITHVYSPMSNLNS